MNRQCVIGRSNGLVLSSFRMVKFNMSQHTTKPTKWHPHSLIRVFAVRTMKAWDLIYPLSAQRRLWSDWANAQADLSLRWAHILFCLLLSSAGLYMYVWIVKVYTVRRQTTKRHRPDVRKVWLWASLIEKTLPIIIHRVSCSISCSIIELNNEDTDSPFQPRVLNARDYELVDFSQEHVCFIVISTSGDGKLMECLRQI